MATTSEVASLLAAWSLGDREAGEKLFPLVYDELKLIAQRHLRRERAQHTLQPTALVHEAYLRLVEQQGVGWQNRHHFFAIAAQSMRRILVDHARAHAASKRGGGSLHVSLHEAAGAVEPEAELLALDQALRELEALDPRQGRVVELRYFGGLSVEETAQVLGISTATVPWYAMQLLEGPTLRQHLQQSGRGPDPQAPQAVGFVLAVVHRLCSPLAFLHGQGLVHRDLKPDNVVLLAGQAPGGGGRTSGGPDFRSWHTCRARESVRAHVEGLEGFCASKDESRPEPPQPLKAASAPA